MIVEELLYQQQPVDVARLAAQQQRDREARNQDALERWEADVGLHPMIRTWRRWPMPLTAAEIENFNRLHSEG